MLSGVLTGGRVDPSYTGQAGLAFGGNRRHPEGFLMKTPIERLRRQIEEIEPLKQLPEDSVEFQKWRRDTEVIIEKTFGSGTRHLHDFKGIRYSLGMISHLTTDEDFRAAYLDGLESARVILQSMIEEFEEYGASNATRVQTETPASIIASRLCRFHLVVRSLRVRHDNRPPLEIEDEYDVQDLLHALLQLDFDDIRREEWTPSYAGGSSRMDFLLKQEQVVIETKKTRKGLGDKEIGQQLLLDIGRYSAHPDCRTLVCFVYDPEGRIGNPAALEGDLSGERDGLTVRVLIVPRGA